MIITIDELLERLETTDGTTLPSIQERRNLEARLRGLEIAVRHMTNNKFHWPEFQTEGQMSFDRDTRKITGAPFQEAGFTVGDSVDLFQDGPVMTTRIIHRDNIQHELGVYTITEVGEDYIIVDEPIRTMSVYAVATLVDYPDDIKDGVANILRYERKMGLKTGIKSETISRYSVTYYDVNGGDTIEGYPASLFGFLDKYKRLRWS